jgi:hypothetical protein
VPGKPAWCIRRSQKTTALTITTLVASPIPIPQPLDNCMDTGYGCDFSKSRKINTTGSDAQHRISESILVRSSSLRFPFQALSNRPIPRFSEHLRISEQSSYPKTGTKPDQANACSPPSPATLLFA